MMHRHLPEKEIYGSETFYREVGIYISRLEQYQRSLHFFDHAIQQSPNDTRAIFGRSRARARAIHYKGALDDMKKVLELVPDNFVALADKALVTYLCNEFEQGLIQNSRLAPLRSKPENFKIGLMHCSDAISNCLAERAGKPLRDHFKIIRRLAWRKNYEDQMQVEPKPKRKKKRKEVKQVAETSAPANPKEPKSRSTESRFSVRSIKSVAQNLAIRNSLHSEKEDSLIIPPLKQDFQYKPLQNYTTNIQNYMAERYLDTMYLDKIFLKKFATLKGATSPNEQGNARIKELAKTGYKTVSYKQEMMRTRRPFYFIKYQEANISGNLQKRQAQELEFQKKAAKKDADTLLTKLKTAYNEKKLRSIVEYADKLRQFCESKRKSILPNKETYFSTLFDLVSKGYYEVYRISKNQTEKDKTYRINVLLGIEGPDNVKSDSVIDFLADSLVDYNKQIEYYEKLLEEALYPKEICWYFYELAKNHLNLRKHDMAQVYLRKCIQKAEDFENLQWQVTAMMLMVKSDIQQFLKHDAETDLDVVYNLAKELKDAKLFAFVKRCIGVVGKSDLSKFHGSEAQLLSTREKNIINMMTTDQMKEEIAHLFSQMSSMPASRRMNVMPGVAKRDLTDKPRKRSVRMSIMPTSVVKDEDALSHKELPERKGDGAEFMNLIQYHV